MPGGGAPSAAALQRSGRTMRLQTKRRRLAVGRLRVPAFPRLPAVIGSTIAPSPFRAPITPSAFPPHLTDILHPHADWPPLLATGFAPLPDGLSDPERASILLALSTSIAESGRLSVATKFCRFWAFCAQTGVSPIPAPANRILAFVQFLRAEGRVSVHFAPQYVSAITTVHPWFAVHDFMATTPLVKTLFDAWRISVADQEARDQVLGFPATSLVALLEAAAHSPDVAILRAALVVGLDFIFFNRADSAFPISAGDLREDGEYIIFCETRFKRKRTDSLVNRVRWFNAARLPSLLACLRLYRDLRMVHYHPEPVPPSFWQLRAEGRPTTALVRRIFEFAATIWPALFPAGVTHHALRRGGATAAHAIGIPLETICFWGGWAFGSNAVYRYVDFTHEPTPADFQAFGWMGLRAADIANEFLRRELPPLPSAP